MYEVISVPILSQQWLAPDTNIVGETRQIVVIWGRSASPKLANIAIFHQNDLQQLRGLAFVQLVFWSMIMRQVALGDL